MYRESFLGLVERIKGSRSYSLLYPAMEVEIMSEGFTERLRRINFPSYINEVQDEIGKTLEAIGKGETEEEREKGKDRLQALLRIQSNKFASELALGGDYNIIFMLTTGMLATAWATFILKAKSLDPRRPVEDRTVMGAYADCMAHSFEEIITQSRDYGAIYDKQKDTR